MRTISASVLCDLSGTIQRPLIAAILPGECGSGHSVLTKVGAEYYKAYAKQMARNWTLYRCKDGWSSAKCKWTGRLRKVMLQGGGFRFDVLDNPKADEHSCNSIDIREKTWLGFPLASRPILAFSKNRSDSQVPCQRT